MGTLLSLAFFGVLLYGAYKVVSMIRQELAKNRSHGGSTNSKWALLELRLIQDEEFLKQALWGRNHEDIPRGEKDQIMKDNFGEGWGTLNTATIARLLIFNYKLYGENWASMTLAEKAEVQEKTFGANYIQMTLAQKFEAIELAPPNT